jgi:hypothetical protein
MPRKNLALYFPFFLILAALAGPFFLLSHRAPALTISGHAFSPFSGIVAVLSGLLFLFFLALWAGYSRLVSSVLAADHEEVLGWDFLTFPPFLFFSLTPLTLGHFIGGKDLRDRLGLFLVGLGCAFFYLKLVQIRRWSAGRELPWRRAEKWFSVLPVNKKLIILFIAALVFFNAGSAVLTIAGITTAGDEPHYLLIDQSLLRDRDLDLTNNYAQRDYDRYMMFPGKLQPHVVPGAKPGSHYSFHSPGIALLLLPFYALGTLFHGQGLILAVRFGMSLFGALFTLQVFLFARSEWKDDRLALLLWFLTGFTAPVFFYSFHVYPEIVVAFLSLALFRIFRFSTKMSWQKFLLAGLMISSFVWFHALKYIALVVPLFLYCLWTAVKKFRPGWKLGLFLAVPAAVFILYLGFQHVLYGSYSLSAVSWAQPMTEGRPLQFIRNLLFGIPFRYRWETLVGYFFDQRDGLLFYAPLYFFALLGAWDMLKRKRKDFFLVFLLTSPYVLTSAFLTQRTGFAPQARPLVAVIWGLIIGMGYFLAENRKKIFGYFFNFAAALSFLFVFLLLKFPLNLYQETTRGIRERGGGLFYLLSNINFRLPDFLPSYIKVENPGWLPNFVWLGAALACMAVYAATKKRAFSLRFSSHLLLASAGVLVFFLWFVLYPRQVLVDPARVIFPSGEKMVFYSLSRSSRQVEPGRFQLREDNRPYRFNFVTEKPVRELKIFFGSTRGDYPCQIKIFDEAVFRGETAREIRTLDLPDPPSYQLRTGSYYELTFYLGKAAGVQTELNPYHLEIIPDY